MKVTELRRRLAGYTPGARGAVLTTDDYDSGGEPTPAAVLVGIVDHGDDPSLLLTVRNADMTHHGGQVAFPGGRSDPGETPGETALREAEEEVALPPDKVDLVCHLDSYKTGSGFLITPVVGIVEPGLSLTPHEAEVSEVFELPLAHALDVANHLENIVDWQGARRRYYRIDWHPQNVWGATAGMIVNLSRILLADR